MRVSRIIMGTGVTLDVPEPEDKKIFDVVFSRLELIDQKFSVYKKESEVFRFQRGEIDESELSDELKQVIQKCRQLEKKTNGYFSAWFSGQFDPTGYVKGWSISEASKVLEKAKVSTFCLSIGGDMNFKSSSDKVWQVGVQNPDSKESVVAIIGAKNLAVATSGNYLRGHHIIDPKTGLEADFLKSLTVCGPDIIWADVLATAGFAANNGWPNIIKEFKDYEALAITSHNELLLSQGMEQLLTKN